MRLILIVSVVLVAVEQATTKPESEPLDSKDGVEREGRILIQDSYSSIMSKLGQQEQEIATLKAQETTLNAELSALMTRENTLETKLASLTAEDITIKAELANLKSQQAVTPKRIAFKAHLTQSISPAPNQLIVFNDVRFNVGNAYRHGTFIAPYTGTYLFSVTMCSGGGHYICVDLLRNGSPIGTILAGDPVWDDCASETTVVELTSGDDVIVQHQSSHGDFIHANDGQHSSYTGVLLY